MEGAGELDSLFSIQRCSDPHLLPRNISPKTIHHMGMFHCAQSKQIPGPETKRNSLRKWSDTLWKEGNPPCPTAALLKQGYCTSSFSERSPFVWDISWQLDHLHHRNSEKSVGVREIPDISMGHVLLNACTLSLALLDNFGLPRPHHGLSGCTYATGLVLSGKLCTNELGVTD